MTYLLVSSFLGHRVLPKGKIKRGKKRGRSKQRPYASHLNPPFREDPVTEERGNKEVGPKTLSHAGLSL